MRPDNPAQPLRTAPIEDLVGVLLKQFKRLLDQNGVTLTTAEIEALGTAIANRQALPPKATSIRQTLHTLLAESEAVLQERFGFTFAQSLATEMDQVEGWETTGEFIELANHKSNAELRISAGATLLVLLGDRAPTEILWQVIEQDGGVWDVDATFAQRALTHAANVAPQADDWREQVQNKL